MEEKNHIFTHPFDHDDAINASQLIIQKLGSWVSCIDDRRAELEIVISIKLLHQPDLSTQLNGIGMSFYTCLLEKVKLFSVP